MLAWLRTHPGAIAIALIGLAGIGITGALLVAWLGLYNVAASRGHWLVIDRFLRFGMENSVEAHAPDIGPPPLGDPDLVRLGAGHFHSGCAYCHGAPGTPISPTARHMLPPPPDLGDRVSIWSDQELFFIVKHGFKYTGMPGWPAPSRDDEVWALVAFLRKLPALDEKSYRELALGDVDIEPQSGHQIATGQISTDAVGACARCHGAGDRPPRSALVPRLHGQPSEMLRGALEAYARGERKSGIMQTAASGLSPTAIQALADYYSSLPPLSPQPAAGPPAVVEVGRRLATEGDAANGIPPCMACHPNTALPLYPRLAGQSGRYIASQLHLWKNGSRSTTAAEAIMAPIARRLSSDQIEALSAYFSSLPLEPALGEGAGR